MQKPYSVGFIQKQLCTDTIIQYRTNSENAHKIDG